MISSRGKPHKKGLVDERYGFIVNRSHLHPCQVINIKALAITDPGEACRLTGGLG